MHWVDRARTSADERMLSWRRARDREEEGTGNRKTGREDNLRTVASFGAVTTANQTMMTLAAKFWPKKKQELKRIEVAGRATDARTKRKIVSESVGDRSKPWAVKKGTVVQCIGETQVGERCRMTSKSCLVIADSLRSGGKFCTHHREQTNSPGTAKGTRRAAGGKVMGKIDSDKGAKAKSAPLKTEEVSAKRRKRIISQALSDEDEVAVPQDSIPPGFQSENTAHSSTGGEKPAGWNRGTASVEPASISSPPASISSFSSSSDDM